MGQLIAEQRQMTIPSEVERIPEVCDFVVEAAENAGLDDRAAYHCQLAVDEWCTNVVEHGFHDNHLNGYLDVTCYRQQDRFVISVVDDCPAFDPTALAEVDIHRPLEEREPGGLGWFLIRKVMDSVEYRLKDGRNQLTMTKLSPLQSPVQTDSPAPFRFYEAGRGVWAVALSGRLDANNHQLLEQSLISQIIGGKTVIAVDLSNVTYISSSGLKVLLTALRQARKSNGNLALAGLSARVREIFEISGFESLFVILPTVAEAVATIAPQ